VNSTRRSAFLGLASSHSELTVRALSALQFFATIPKGSATLREERERVARWRPTFAGLNFPPWWDYPDVLLESSPFSSSEDTGWDLPTTPTFPADRNIFHEEGCTCPTDSVLVPVPGYGDYQGRYDDQKWVDDSRQNAKRIQEFVDLEFNRLFDQARQAENHCPFAQQLWGVLHYCNLPCNVARTTNGRAVGRLLQPVLYDVLNHDCLRWLYPGQFDRICRSALRIIPVIIEKCILRARLHGSEGIAVPPLLGGAWGFGFQLDPIQHSWYITKLVHNIVSCYLVKLESSKKRPRLAIKIRPFHEADFDHLWESQVITDPVPTPEINLVNTEVIQSHCQRFQHDPEWPDFPDSVSYWSDFSPIAEGEEEAFQASMQS
jgi:hypothetical protein